MGRQAGQGSGLPPALAERFPLEPGEPPPDLYGRRRQERLEGRARPAQGATLAPSQAPDAWREAPLHARPPGLRGFARGPRLALSRGLERLRVGLRPHREWPRGGLRSGAHLTRRPEAPGGPVKAAPQAWSPRARGARRPWDPGLPLRAVGLRGGPIPQQGLAGRAGLLRLPALGPAGRPPASALMGPLGGDEEGRLPRAASESGRPRAASTWGPGLLKSRAQAPSRGGGGRGAPRRAQSGLPHLPGLREVERVAPPRASPLTAIARLPVIRGWAEHCRRGPRVRGAPAAGRQCGTGAAVRRVAPQLP